MKKVLMDYLREKIQETVFIHSEIFKSAYKTMLFVMANEPEEDEKDAL